MSMLCKMLMRIRARLLAGLASAAMFVADVGRGLLVISHNTLALIGLLLVAAALFVVGQDELRHEAELQFLGWLQARQSARVEPVAEMPAEVDVENAVARATAADPKELDRQQAAVAHWLSRRYRVAPEPISRLVQEAWALGKHASLEPTLILAIMAVESSFNPFAQSSVGAQGLMQVMTKVHDDKYERFGGNYAAFDPVTNLRVGVLVLKECIARAGSLEAGLRFYVGAANLADDGGYANKVLVEQNYLRLVMSGKSVPHFSAQATATAPTVLAQGNTEPLGVATPAASPEGDGPDGTPRLN
jgi:soluble lytic murein transglycosylase-like protein